jgi:6-phosphogluconolactonase
MHATCSKRLVFVLLCGHALAACDGTTDGAATPSGQQDASISPTSGGGGGVAGITGGAGGSGGTLAPVDAATDGASNDAAVQMDAGGVGDARVGLDGGPNPDASIDTGPIYVYVGTGDWGGPDVGGIDAYRLEDDGALTSIAGIESGNIAAYMAMDLARRQLYVADEGPGALRRYDVNAGTGQLTLDDTIDIPESPVYVALDSRGRTLFSASYDNGLMRVFALRDDGFVEPASDVETTGAQAHSVTITADDAFVYVCNKGTNTISQLAFDPDTHTLTPLAPAAAPHAGGPRHAALSADGRFLYAVSELDDSVRVHARSASGTLSLVQSYARLPSGQTGTGAHILVSPRGQLYVSNRGPSNTIAVFDIDTSSGLLTLVEHEETLGNTPRDFAIDPAGRFLIVGNLDSQNIVVFAIDQDSGALTHTSTVEIDGSPFFVGAYRF